MRQKEKIIIFDFDGVIVDSFKVALEVNQLATPTLTTERYRAKFNGNIADAPHDDPVVREIDFFAEYGQRFQSLGIDDYIKEIIIKLCKKFPLFIVSSTTNRIISDYLTRHGIRHCFEEIFGFDIEKSKIKKFNMLFKKWGVLPENTVFLTDTVGDILEARAAGIELIVGILGGYQHEKTLRAAQPKKIVKNMHEFSLFIQKIFS